MNKTNLETSCPLCENGNYTYIFTEQGFDLVRCDTCDLFFITPFPYDQHNRVKEYSYDHLVISDVDSKYETEKRRFNEKIDDFEELIRGAKSILDVGCGTGYFLKLVGERYPDMRCVGIELNRERAEYARIHSKCKVIQIPIEEMPDDESFDIIILYNVLSHVQFLDNLFIKIKTLLNPSGKFVIVAGEHTGDIKKSDVFDWGIPDHLHFLGLSTMDYICRKYKFRKIKHDKKPFESELFSKSFFLSPGRSPIRNKIKYIIAHTPCVLSFLGYGYYLLKGKRTYTSTFVLTSV